MINICCPNGVTGEGGVLMERSSMKSNHADRKDRYGGAVRADTTKGEVEK